MSCVEDRFSFPNKPLFSLKHKHVVKKRLQCFIILDSIFSNIFWSWTKSEAFSRVLHSRHFMKNINCHTLPAIYVRSASANVPAVLCFKNSKNIKELNENVSIFFNNERLAARECNSNAILTRMLQNYNTNKHEIQWDTWQKLTGK